LGLKEGGSFRYLFSKFVETDEISLNFIKRQIDEHTCDLRGVVFSSNLFNKLEDVFSNLSLVVGVTRSNSGHKHVTFLGIGLFN
jgi:hypothetical protein